MPSLKSFCCCLRLLRWPIVTWDCRPIRWAVTLWRLLHCRKASILLNSQQITKTSNPSAHCSTFQICMCCKPAFPEGLRNSLRWVPPQESPLQMPKSMSLRVTITRTKSNYGLRLMWINTEKLSISRIAMHLLFAIRLSLLTINSACGMLIIPTIQRVKTM